MKIPEKIVIAGQEIKVEIVDSIDYKHTLGATDNILNQLKIASTYKGEEIPKQQIELCFIHEITHQLFDKLGEHQLSGNEKLVEQFSLLLHQVIAQLIPTNEAPPKEINISHEDHAKIENICNEESIKPFFVKILKVSYTDFWYKDHIGKVFEVCHHPSKVNYQLFDDMERGDESVRLINIYDCAPVNDDTPTNKEIKYDIPKCLLKESYHVLAWAAKIIPKEDTPFQKAADTLLNKIDKLI